MHGHRPAGSSPRPIPRAEILKPSAAVTMNVAKHTGKGKGRSMRTYRKGNVQELLQVGTLAAQSLVAQPFDETVSERALLTSLVASYLVKDWTPLADRGPLMVGIAHSDYTAAEVEQFIENTGSWNQADLIQQEVGKRKIRIVGIFKSDSAGSGLIGSYLNNGTPIKTKLNWVLNSGETIDLWVYNMGQVAFATTDPQVHVAGHVNLFSI